MPNAHGGGSVTKRIGPRAVQKTEAAYPRPRDRRLSRKTRAAVGKPPASAIAASAVSSADSRSEVTPPIGHWKAAATIAAVANHDKLAQHQPNSISLLAESARLMPVTASPMPAHAGTNAGHISCNPAAERLGDIGSSSGPIDARTPPTCIAAAPDGLHSQQAQPAGR